MKTAMVVLSLFLFLSTQTQAWSIKADFERGVLGQKAEGPDAFHGAKKLTVFDDTHVLSGSRSAKATITEGSDGWREWGGRWTFPSALHEGDELWYRVWVWIEPNWGWNLGSKGTRIHTVSSTGANEGYLDILLYNHQFRVASEVSPALFNQNNGEAQYLPPIPLGQWHCVESYIKFHSVPGQAVERVWRDGVLVFEDMDTNTLRKPTSFSEFVFLFGYFDEAAAPHTQSLWIDNVALTNEQPDNRDAHGNPFIGPGPAGVNGRPGTPAGVNVNTQEP